MIGARAAARIAFQAATLLCGASRRRRTHAPLAGGGTGDAINGMPAARAKASTPATAGAASSGPFTATTISTTPSAAALACRLASVAGRSSSPVLAGTPIVSASARRGGRGHAARRMAVTVGRVTR